MAPLVKVTVPVGAGPLVSGGATATVAVYVTGWPTTGVDVEADTDVLLDAWLIDTPAWPDEDSVAVSPE